MKRLLLIVAFLLPAGLCFAGTFYGLGGNDPMIYVVTGTVEKITVNALDIRDESDKQLRRFIYFGSEAAVGDRVRVRFEPYSRRIEMLKKMTKLEYNPEGQNLGYIFKGEPAASSECTSCAAK